MSDLPKAVPKWTAWPEVTSHGVPMAYVKLDVGQFSFRAGKQYRPDDPQDFVRCVGDVMGAITMHAVSRGWL